MERPWVYFGTIRAGVGLDGVLTKGGCGCAMVVTLLLGKFCCAGGRRMVKYFPGFSGTGTGGVVFLQRTRRLVLNWSSLLASMMIES